MTPEGSISVVVGRTVKGPRIGLVVYDRVVDLSPAAALAMAGALTDAAADAMTLGAKRGDIADIELHDTDDVVMVEGPVT